MTSMRAFWKINTPIAVTFWNIARVNLMNHVYQYLQNKICCENCDFWIFFKLTCLTNLMHSPILQSVAKIRSSLQMIFFSNWNSKVRMLWLSNLVIFGKTDFLQSSFKYVLLFYKHSTQFIENMENYRKENG